MDLFTTCPKRPSVKILGKSHIFCLSTSALESVSVLSERVFGSL
jgi:hypothetical protein